MLLYYVGGGQDRPRLIKRNVPPLININFFLDIIINLLQDSFQDPFVIENYRTMKAKLFRMYERFLIV